MASVLQGLSNAFTSCGDIVSDVFTKVVTLNYHVGSITFSALQCTYFFLYSVVCSVLTAVGLALEDLVVFLVESTDILAAVLHLFIQAIETIVNGIIHGGKVTVDGVLAIFNSLICGAQQVYLFTQFCSSQAMLLVTLMGRSCVLLCGLLSQTLVLLATLTKSTIISAVTNSKQFSKQILTELYTAPFELYLGLIVGILSVVFLSKVVVRRIRESNITVEMIGSIILSVVSSTYVMIVRTFARLIGLIFSIIIITVNNLRLPMVSYAGESDEDSDDEDNASVDGDDRRKLKRFDLIANAGLENEDSVEAELYRQVQREREDKLCVICVDKMKRVMMLPCRHLCVCERCWEHLEASERGGSCPLCRKPVQQIIKAYL
eukprot:TRINITY_DN12898_c0_g1_i1.p1 TRINITY_DN12898_c0_g1~~TRINITY_DN12898_c0_g1_i1.p1  ORF type:complete len:376 (+),score=45.57 TRINITY_DN12898_c0_g1_i1:73-1200(+)